MFSETLSSFGAYTHAWISKNLYMQNMQNFDLLKSINAACSYYKYMIINQNGKAFSNTAWSLSPSRPNIFNNKKHIAYKIVNRYYYLS